MSTDSSAAEKVADNSGEQLTSDQVAEYLQANPEFFLEQDELLADLSLPHESGKAISLLERQVTILRERGIEARQKLNNLLLNARNNDELFDTTRNLVLALLRARDVTEIANVAQDQLTNHANIESCEIIFVENSNLNASDSLRFSTAERLKTEYADVFRLKRTHCGQLNDEQLKFLFPNNSTEIKSTALCPVVHNSEVLALLAFGNVIENFFNVNLDTLFLDFIGQVIGAVLDKELSSVPDAKS